MPVVERFRLASYCGERVGVTLGLRIPTVQQVVFGSLLTERGTTLMVTLMPQMLLYRYRMRGLFKCGPVEQGAVTGRQHAKDWCSPEPSVGTIERSPARIDYIEFLEGSIANFFEQIQERPVEFH